MVGADTRGRLLRLRPWFWDWRRRWERVLSGFMSDTTQWWTVTTIIHFRVSQVSQVIIKLLVAKIIIKVLFLPVTPVTTRSSENTVD